MERIRDYETTFILNPDMDEEDRDSLMERINGIITDNGGEISDTDVWGMRKLAYEINDYTNGFYTVLSFSGNADLVNELERNFKLISDVLRYLIIRVED